MCVWGGGGDPFSEKELFNQKSCPDKGTVAIIYEEFASVSIFGCAFSKTSDSDQLHRKTHLKSQIERQFYDFRKRTSKIESFSSIFLFVPLPVCLQESEWNQLQGDIFNSEFNSFYDYSASWGSEEGWKDFPLFLQIQWPLKGNFIFFEASLSGETEWNKLLVWFLNSGWERYSICSASSGTNRYNTCTKRQDHGFQKSWTNSEKYTLKILHTKAYRMHLLWQINSV